VIEMGMDRARDAGLLALRLGVGGTLVAHGTQKLFGWFGGHGIKGTAGAFEQMGFRPGRPSAMAAGLSEAAGGTMIMVGFGTPAAGSIAAGTMVAASSVHTPNGFFSANGGYELPALLGLSAAALSLTGPGDWSLDRLAGHRLNRPWMAVAGLLTSTAASLLVVRHRRRVLAAQGGITEAQAPADSPATPAAAPAPSEP